MKILVTGSAGFIGFHVCKKLLSKGNEVIGIDNLNNYYDIDLKKNRNKILKKSKKFTFYKKNICDKKIDKIFKKYKFKIVINLAAQAGVRYSLKNPYSYFESNLLGFGNIIELSKKYKVGHFIYASSSSVYGAEKKLPYNEKKSDTSSPIQVYAATKKSNELIAHAYSHLFKFKTTGLRFFTVYGPWGRPDMALFKFTKNILEKKSIEVYNNGKNIRDFTFIDDIVSGVVKTINKKNKLSNFEIINLGNNNPLNVMKYIKTIEKLIRVKAIKKLIKSQPGDMVKTYSDNTKSKKLIGYKPKIKIDLGIKKFIEWYKNYYKVNK